MLPLIGLPLSVPRLSQARARPRPRAVSPGPQASGTRSAMKTLSWEDQTRRPRERPPSPHESYTQHLLEVQRQPHGLELDLVPVVVRRVQVFQLLAPGDHELRIQTPRLVLRRRRRPLPQRIQLLLRALGLELDLRERKRRGETRSTAATASSTAATRRVRSRARPVTTRCVCGGRIACARLRGPELPRRTPVATL